MLEELCRELNNWFDENPKDGSKRHYFGEYVIENGALDLTKIGIQIGQYFRIVGSVFNDGVYKYEPDHRPVLIDETFSGAVWAMAVPSTVIALADEIAEWKSKYGGIDSVAMSPFQSESFGGYSYSKGGGGSGSGASGASVSWENAFSSKLSKWRKIRP